MSQTIVGVLLLVSETASALPEVVYCCFTRTTLLNVYHDYLLCSLNSTCIPSFVLIGCSVTCPAMYSS